MGFVTGRAVPHACSCGGWGLSAALQLVPDMDQGALHVRGRNLRVQSVGELPRGVKQKQHISLDMLRFPPGSYLVRERFQVMLDRKWYPDFGLVTEDVPVPQARPVRLCGSILITNGHSVWGIPDFPSF